MTEILLEADRRKINVNQDLHLKYSFRKTGSNQKANHVQVKDEALKLLYKNISLLHAPHTCSLSFTLLAPFKITRLCERCFFLSFASAAWWRGG